MSWNYNYGAFSNAMYGDSMILLRNPDLVATTWLNFAASMWFFVTPQPPKPSMLQVLDGSWTPNSHDQASNLVPGFGVTTMIINGAIECGQYSQNAVNRANYYTEYAAKLNVDISGEKLACDDMQQFSDSGAAGQLALYWAPESDCSLVKWQTAYSALIEGDFAKCKGLAPTCNEGQGTTTTSATTTQTTSGGGQTTSSTECEAREPKKVVCYYPNWPYYRNGNGKYLVENIDPSICTHIIYSFVILDATNYVMKIHDPWLDIDLGNINKFLQLKQTNPNVKLLVALGGWNDSRTSKYSILLADPAKRAAFVTHAVTFITQYGFDGLDLDYEYPVYDGVASDRQGFTALVQELRTAFDPYSWELTAAVSASKSVVDAGYDVPEISAALDAIHLMSYDLHGSWETSVNHHAPLFGQQGDDLNVDVA